MRPPLTNLLGAAGLLLASLAIAAPPPPRMDFSDVGVYACEYDFCDFANLKFTGSAAPEDYKARVERVHERGQKMALGLYTWDRVTHKKPLEEVFADTDKILDAVDLSKVDLIFLHEEEVDWQGGFPYLNAIYDHVKAKYDGPVYQWYSMPMGPRCDQKADGWILDAYGMDYDTFRKHLMRFIVIDKPVIACINATPGVNTLQCSKEQVRVCEEFNVPVFYYCVHGPMGSPNLYFASDDPLLAKWRSWFFQTLEQCHETDVSRLPAESAQHSWSEDFEVAGDGREQFSFADDFSSDSFLRRATIHGFLNLAWSSVDGKLRLKTGGGEGQLVYHLSTPFEFAAPSATVTGEGALELALSANGKDWTEGEATCELPDMKGRNLWVRVTLAQPEQGQTVLDELRVTGAFAGPSDRAFHLATVPPDREKLTHVSASQVSYEDTFDSQRYLYMSEITGAQDLGWQPGVLTTHGIEGRASRVQIKQHFICDRPVDLSLVKLDCVSYANFGAHNELALSLDGQTPIAADTTSGKERERDKRFYGELALDLADEPQTQAVSEFWVHLTLVNNCGKQSNTTNQLKKLTVEGKVSEGE